MTRLGVVFWGGLVLASGFATFNVKYAVQGIDDELARVRRQTAAEQQEIRSLTAEWAYLNQPERLAELNRNFLQLTPMTAKQLQGRVEEIALRAPPAAVPETLFAATPPAAANPLAATSAAASPVPSGAAASSRAMQAGGTPTAEAKTAEAPAGMTRSVDVQGTAPKGDEAPAVGTSADGALALAEAQRLLGIDAGRQSSARAIGQGGSDRRGAGRRSAGGRCRFRRNTARRCLGGGGGRAGRGLEPARQ